MIEAGTVLQGRYRIEKQIGQGGMGAVYVATDERFGSTVAIKETFFADSKYRKAFEREARLLNSLRHSALPRVSDHFIESTGQFLVMEYITGEDLSAIMENSEKAFPLNDVLNWANQLLDALDFLHSQEIPVIHRDIKPQNLKLTPKGQIVLLDFGLAKGNPTDASHQTAAKSVFGYSRNYASLEQIQGTGTDPRSDLYSLGATLYHLITGVPPADALTRAMNVLNGQPDSLVPAHLVHHQVPKGVADVLQKAMALNSGERPSTASQMRRMLFESDKNTSSDSAETLVAKPVSSDILAQDTKLMSDDSIAQNLKQSKVKTETMPENLTEETSVRTKVFPSEPGSNATESRHFAQDTAGPKSRKAVAAALLGMLLIGSAASAMYYYKPDLFQENINAIENGEKNPMTEISPVLNSNAEIANARLANINSDVESVDEVTVAGPNLPKSEAKTQSQSVSKTTEAAKNKSKETKSESNSYTYVYDGEGNVKMSNGRIVTDQVIIEGNRVIMKHPPKYPLPPKIEGKYISPEEFQRMTPAQKRKLVQMLNERERLRQMEERKKNANTAPPVRPTPY